jgi:hypothetical protein
MKKLLKLFFVLIVSCGTPVVKTSNPQLLISLDNLIEAQDYFNLKANFNQNKAQLSTEYSSLYYNK